MFQFISHSIKGKLLISFFLLFGLALLFQIIYIVPTLQERKIEDIRKSQDGFAEFLAGEISYRLDMAVMEIEKMASLNSIASLEKEAVDGTISTINSSNHFFNYYFVMDEEGRWLSYPSHPELVGKKIPKENMSWVNQTFKTEKTIFLDVVKSNIGTLVSGFSTPVRGKDGNVIALLRGVFVLSENNSFVKSIERTITIKGYESYLVSSNGWLIANSSQKLNYGEFNSYSMMKYEPVKKVLKGQKGTVTYLYGGKPWLAAFYPIGVADWGLIVHKPLESIVLAAKAEARFIIFIIISCFCIGLIIAAIVVQKALNPLFKLVKHIKSGAVDIVSGYSKDEIGQLALQYSKLYNDLYQSSKMTRRSETKFRTLFNNTNDAIYICDFKGSLLEANQKATDDTGYDHNELMGMNIMDVMDIDAPETANFTQGWIDKTKQDKQLIFEAVNVTKTGPLVPVEISSRAIEYDSQQAILSVARDLTERKKFEDERKQFETKLIQAQKMESIGTLAGGIAHDFNNLLMGIQGRISMMLGDMTPSHKNWEDMDAIEKYTQSATGLTSQLLGFARRGKYVVKPINISEVVNSSATLFGRTRKEINIHTRFESSAIIVEADQSQMEQVLLNMYINAWHAMPEGGELCLETKAVNLDEEYCKPYRLKPGEFARISVTDSGIGMDEATRKCVFDPFFTTKEVSRGTGLGLASAFGIIQNHDGIITVYSEIGRGTTFNIYLPISNKDMDQETDQEADQDRGMIQGTETVLLVDDEEMIVDVAQGMLERLGYSVVAVGGGSEALKKLKDLGGKIDLVILDLIMPGMDGEKTFQHIHEAWPRMPVILSSGYALNGKAEKLLLQGCNGFIQKPFNISELSIKIKKVLKQ
jgi:PAS domain S-box-containing protein